MSQAIAQRSGSLLGGLRAWWRADRGALLQLGGLLVAVISFLALIPSLLRVGGAEPLLGNLVIHLYVAVWLLIATAFTRSIGLREVVVAWLMGTFLVPTLVFLPGIPARNWLGDDSAVMAVYWASLLEETGLILVIGLLILRLTRRAGRAPGPMDVFILGFAVGGGYGVHEDALYGRLLASLPATTPGPAFEATYGLLWPVFVEPPAAIVGPGYGLYTYHAGHGAFFGLLFAVVLLLVHRWRPIVWLLPLGWTYAVVEHALANLQLSVGPHPLRWLFLSGHVIALLLIVAVPVLLAVEVWFRRQVAVPVPPLDRAVVGGALRQAAGPVDTVVRALAGLRYHRTRNALLYDAARRPVPQAAHLRPLEAWARVLVEGRGVLTGRPERPTASTGVPRAAGPGPAGAGVAGGAAGAGVAAAPPAGLPASTPAAPRAATSTPVPPPPVTAAPTPPHHPPPAPPPAPPSAGPSRPDQRPPTPPPHAR